MCGERLSSRTSCRFYIGSSPRVWGTPLNRLSALRAVRFIPTCVGNARWLNVPSIIFAVHPHVCGERMSGYNYFFRLYGSSPRVWGTLGNKCGCRCDDRFIPTCVGNAPNRPELPIYLSVHPHVCGERRKIATSASSATGSSPRVWGTPPGHGPDVHTRRFIPTCVGNA